MFISCHFQLFILLATVEGGEPSQKKAERQIEMGGKWHMPPTLPCSGIFNFPRILRSDFVRLFRLHLFNIRKQADNLPRQYLKYQMKRCCCSYCLWCNGIQYGKRRREMLLSNIAKYCQRFVWVISVKKLIQYIPGTVFRRWFPHWFGSHENPPSIEDYPTLARTSSSGRGSMWWPWRWRWRRRSRHTIFQKCALRGVGEGMK